MKMTRVASSNINAIGYSEALKQLHVEFKGGKTFAYTDVSKEEFAALTAAPSTGKHFVQHIKAVKECFEAVEGWQEELIAKLKRCKEMSDTLAEQRIQLCKNKDAEINKLQADNGLLRDELKKFLPMVFDENGDEDCDNSHGDFQYNEGSECMGDSVIAVLAATAKG